MSPEPTQQPMNKEFIDENLSIDIMVDNHDSDSDDDEIETAGYLPLSQIATDSDLIIDYVDNDNEDDESLSLTIELDVQTILPTTDTQVQPPLETHQLWSSPTNKSNIHLDAVKINEVKSMMANFILPETAFPEWASTVTEDIWKSQLVNRIKEIQKEF